MFVNYLTAILEVVAYSPPTKTLAKYKPEAKEEVLITSFTLEATTNYAVSWFIRATTTANSGSTTASVSASSVDTNLLFSDSANNVIINSTTTQMSGGVSADRIRTNATTSVTFTLAGVGVGITGAATLANSRFIVNVTKL